VARNLRTCRKKIVNNLFSSPLTLEKKKRKKEGIKCPMDIIMYLVL